MTNCGLLFPLLLVAAGAFGYAQDEPPSAFDFDTSNMKVTVAMDRTTYLPGEVAQVTLDVSNPGSTPVVSLTPFLSATGCLCFRQRVGSTLLGKVDCGESPVDPSNMTKFEPGASKRVVLNSYDSMFDLEKSAMEGAGVPEFPGIYGFTYRYGSSTATAEYTVAAARLEADVTARVHDLMFTDHPALVPPKPFPMYVHVLALRSEGKSYICVQQNAVTHATLIAKKADIGSGLDFSYPHVDIASATPLKRVATSDAPVVSLSAVADDQENLTIRWTDSNGRQETLNYPASYPARAPRQEQ